MSPRMMASAGLLSTLMSSLATCWICVITDCNFRLHNSSTINKYINCEGFELSNPCMLEQNDDVNLYTRATSPYKNWTMPHCMNRSIKVLDNL